MSSGAGIQGGGLGRRSFLALWSMFAGLAISYGTAFAYGIRYIFGRQAPPRMLQVLVANMADIPDGGSLIASDLSRRKFLLVRSGSQIRAFSTACTHLGCQVFWKPDKEIFFCPCHDGVFDKDGGPVSGPPPTPLAQYPVKTRGQSVFVQMPEA